MRNTEEDRREARSAICTLCNVAIDLYIEAANDILEVRKTAATTIARCAIGEKLESANLYAESAQRLASVLTTWEAKR